jgi:AcrR family transcriptional regulator
MTATNPQARPAGMTSEKLRETPGAKAAESAPRRQKTAKFDRKLVEILRTAASVFAEVGYDPASIRMVADRAGVSVAGLYYYVRSKDELLYLIQYHVFDGLVRRFASDSAQMLAAGGEAARPQARLHRFIHNHLDHFLTDMASLTVCTRELGRLSGDYLQQVETLQRAYFHQAFEIFLELCSTHDDRRMDPRPATLALFGTINWVSSWYDEASDTSAGELAGEFAKLYLRGVDATDENSAGTFKGVAVRMTETASPRKSRGRP